MSSARIRRRRARHTPRGTLPRSRQTTARPFLLTFPRPRTTTTHLHAAVPRSRPHTLEPRCRARAAHVTRSRAQCSFGIAARTAIGHSRRYTEKSTKSGRRKETEPQRQSAGKSPTSIRGTVRNSARCIRAGRETTSPIRLGHARRRRHPLPVHTDRARSVSHTRRAVQYSIFVDTFVLVSDQLQHPSTVLRPVVTDM